MQHIYRTYNTEFTSDLGITEITRRLWHEQESNSKIPFSKSGHLMSRQVVIYSSLSCLKHWNSNLKMKKRQGKWLTYPGGLWKCISNPNLGLDSGHGTRQVNWDFSEAAILSSKSHSTFHYPCHQLRWNVLKTITDITWMDYRRKPMPAETHLFLIACPVGHLQILIQEVQAQLVNRRFKEVVFHEAKEKRQFSISLFSCSAFRAPPFCGFCFQGWRHLHLQFL